MKTPNVAILANEVLEMHEVKTLPVDPMWIARAEGIELAPHDEGGDFDGYLEYLPRENIFILQYRERRDNPSRVRFTVAHELGHYYIPEHQEAVLRGKRHVSQVEFHSNQRYEEDADNFAANLLMPSMLFGRAMRDVSVKELARLSSLFATSYITTARRMIDETDHLCSVVLSDGRQVNYARHSLAMREAGIYGINMGGRR